MTLPGHPWVPIKNFSPFGPAVWPAIGNIYLLASSPIFLKEP